MFNCEIAFGFYRKENLWSLEAVKTLQGLSSSLRALPLFPLKLLGTAGSGEGKKAAITLRGVKEQLTEHRIPPQSTRTPFQRTKTSKNRVVYQLIVEKHQVTHALSLSPSPPPPRHSSSLSLLHTLCWLVPWVALVPMWEPSRPSSLTQLTADESLPGWHYLKGTHLPLFWPGCPFISQGKLITLLHQWTLAKRAWVSVWTTAIARLTGNSRCCVAFKDVGSFLEGRRDFWLDLTTSEALSTAKFNRQACKEPCLYLRPSKGRGHAQWDPHAL